MQFDKLLGQGKPKSGPFSLVSVVASHLAKFLEDLCLIVRRDPDPGVADRDFHRAVSLPGLNADLSALWRELHGIGKKVKKNLFNLALVTNKITKPLINCNVEVDP